MTDPEGYTLLVPSKHTCKTKEDLLFSVFGESIYTGNIGRLRDSMIVTPLTTSAAEIHGL